MKRLKAKLALLMTFVFLLQSLTGVIVVTGTKAEAAGSLTLKLVIKCDAGDKEITLKGTPGETITFDNPCPKGYIIKDATTDDPGEFKKLPLSEGNGKTNKFSFTFVDQNVVMTCTTRLIRYKISYDGGATGVEGRMKTSQRLEYNQNYKIPKNEFTSIRKFEFIGFNTELDGSGKSFKEGQVVKGLTNVDYATVKLYAQWKEPAKSGEVSGSIFSGGNIGIWIGLAVIVSLLAVTGVIVVRRKKQ